MSAVLLAHPRRSEQLARRLIAARGHFVAYRPGEPNHCPGCSRSHWWVDRILAECAFCATALPIVTNSPGKEA